MLKGFDAVYLGAGQAQTVTFSLSLFDLSIWNSATQSYEPQTGTIGISVGSSSRNIRLTGLL
jgi:beta-glucosidase